MWRINDERGPLTSSLISKEWTTSPRHLCTRCQGDKHAISSCAFLSPLSTTEGRRRRFTEAERAVQGRLRADRLWFFSFFSSCYECFFTPESSEGVPALF